MANTTFNILPSFGVQYSQYPAGNYVPAPTALTANAAGSLVTLDFLDNTLGLATNVLRRSTSSGGTYSDVATLSPGTTHYVDTPPTSGTYYYQVTAYFNGAPSATSNTASATISAVVAPTLAAPSMSSNGCTIAFSGGGGYTTLIPQYSNNAGATWTSISNDTTSPLTFTGLSAGDYSFRALADGTVASNVVMGTVAASGGWQLAAGHYVPQKRAMIAVYPRPDSETGAYGGAVNAYHRWAYYDGVNAIQYEVPLKILFGAPPHRYSILSQPTGETATIGNAYGDPSSHGVFKWIPSRAFTTIAPAAFTVRVTGQDGNYIDVSWTAATDSSPSRFAFVSNTGSDSTGTGSISAPFATLAKVTGGGQSKTVATYPGRIVYLRGGSYSTVAHTDAWNGGNSGESVKCRLELFSARHPMAYFAYPGETVNINFAGAEVTVEGDDCIWSGSSTSKMVIQESANNAAETHNFWLYEQKRVGFQWVDFDGFVPRTAGNFTNSAPIFASGSNTTPTRNYVHLHNVREINRTATAANDGLLFVMFGTKYWVDEYCSGSRSGGPGAAMKDTCYSTSSRYMNISIPDQTFAYAFMGQSGSGDNEVCFSRINGVLFFNFQANSTVTAQWSFRNTVSTIDSNYAPAIRAWPAVGPYTSENDCVISNATPHIANGTSGMATITATGTECQANSSSANKPFDVSTGLLQNVAGGTAWRDLYYGTRGWEIN